MFKDRYDAGRFLAGKLAPYRNRPGTIVLALPRGGVPVAYQIAEELNLPLDVLIVRKLGVPGQEELAMGAIATGGIRILNEDIVRRLDLPPEVIDDAVAREMEELRRREVLYRGARPAPEVINCTVIVVDDGLATGASMRVAVEALRHHNPARIVVAVPVAPASTCEEIRKVADEVICADTPEPFYAVGSGYERFDQTTDFEVQNLLGQAHGLRAHEKSRKAGPQEQSS